MTTPGKRKGGLARAASLTAARRQEIARAAANARWSAPVIDFETKRPVNTGVLLHIAAKNPDSPEAAAVTSGQVVVEPRHALVIDHEPSAPIIMIPAADFAAILAAIDALRAQLLSYQK